MTPGPDGALRLAGTHQGEAIGPVVETASIREAIPSWNADTPPGTWLEARLRVRHDGGWTPWYRLGVWAADESVVQRHSIGGQKDAVSSVATDTVRLHAAEGNAVQLALHLFASPGAGEGVSPIVRAAAIACSGPPAPPAPPVEASVSRLPGRVLAVPAYSQMVYPDGGNVWCSPTSISMVLAYWHREPGDAEARVRHAVRGVYDWVYDGHGNWPFNTAYAATFGVEAYVARLRNLAEAERWIEAGVPLILSYGWRAGELTGAPLRSSNGHLVVLVGFDAQGHPVVNDPAAPHDASVRRVYRRGEIERLWLSRSAGTAYLIHPPGWPAPDAAA